MKERTGKGLRLIVFLSLVVSALIFAGCGGNGENGGSSSDYLETQGSDTMVNMGQSLAEYYMDEVNPEASISVAGGGSGTGIAAIINDDIDIAQSSRAMTEEEIADAAERDVEVYEFIVGQDGIAMVVHEDNPLEKISLPELKQIFTGEVSDWSEFGWRNGGKISIYSRQSSSGTYVFFNELVMDGEDFAEDSHFMPGTSAIADGVEGDRGAIGYVGVGYVRDGIKPLEVSVEKEGDYFTPLEAENVNTGAYPLARPLYFYTNGPPEGEMLDYLEWVLSEEGQNVILDAGFYMNTPEYQEINENTFREAGVE